MKLTAEFISRLPLPSHAWTYEIINSAPHYTVRNADFANVFWVDLWYNVLAERFRSQNVIKRIELLDLTLPVVLTERLELVSAQPVLENIVYYGGLDVEEKPTLLLNASMSYVLLLSLVVFLAIAAACLHYEPIRPYIDLV